MIISHKHKFIIINIPKTGTRSYRETLHGHVDVTGVGLRHCVETDIYQHERAVDAIPKFKANNWDWDMYFKYTTVRNPWARYASFYWWLQTKYQNFSNRDPNSLNQVQQNALKYFTKVFNRCNFDDTKIFRDIVDTQYSQDQFFMVNNTIAVDYIARLENIKNDFEFFCKTTDLPTNLVFKHENKNEPYDYKDMYTQELIDIVAEKERYVIDNHGYQY